MADIGERKEVLSIERLEEYRSYIYSIIYRITGNKEDTEELINDVYYKSWKVLNGGAYYDVKKTLAMIARQLAVNRCVSESAAKRGNGTYTEALSDWENVLPDSNASDMGERLALRDALERFLRSLGAYDREVFVLRYWHLYRPEEIARMIGSSEKSVSSSLKKSKGVLRKTLEKEGFEL